MIRAVLHRHTLRSNAHSTLGTLLFSEGQKRPIYTLELPWKDNERNVSCILCGEYAVVPHDGPKFKDCWRLLEVPERSGILIHIGNTPNDTQGCILPGLGQTPFGVYESAKAFELIREIVGGTDKWMLKVTDDEGYLAI